MCQGRSIAFVVCLLHTVVVQGANLNEPIEPINGLNKDGIDPDSFSNTLNDSLKTKVEATV